jgi:hypothetical protein
VAVVSILPQVRAVVLVEVQQVLQPRTVLVPQVRVMMVVMVEHSHRVRAVVVLQQ